MNERSPKARWNAEQQLLAEEFSGAGADNISYDYFKNMASLSVVTLGGVLGLSEGVFAGKILMPQMMVSSALIAFSGLVSLQCQSDIMQVVRGRKAPTRWLSWGHRLVPGLFGGGVGVFLVAISGIFT